MKKKNRMPTASLALALFFAGGCLAGNTSGIMVSNGRLTVEDREFAMNLKLESDIVEQTAGGFLNARISLKNTNHEDYSCQYMVEWLDANGYAMAHNESQWTPLVLHGRETAVINKSCTLGGAKDFRLKVRPMRGGSYRDAADIVPGESGIMEYPDKTRAAQQMLEKFLSDPDFGTIYSNALARANAGKRNRPLIAVGDFEDNSRPGASDYRSMGQIRSEIKSRIRKTGLFGIVDFRTQDIAAIDSVDLMLTCEIAKDNTGKVYFHFMNMRITDPATGEEIWQDTVKIVKGGE